MSDDVKSDPPAEVTALQDLIAGGVAGSASVIVGHPFDTIKVWMQTSTSSSVNIAAFGGFTSLFRGMLAPLSTAAVVNSIIFSSFGESSRIWDQFFYPQNNEKKTVNSSEQSQGLQSQNDNGRSQVADHSSWQKSFVCGSFTGMVQTLVVCPSDHVKCRIQVQPGNKAQLFKGPFDAGDKILSSHGVRGLYRGFCCTTIREVPSFGIYFGAYDAVKEYTTKVLGKYTVADESRVGQEGGDRPMSSWAASAIAGGFSGALTWAVVYPFDIIKTRIQTLPMDTPIEQRRILAVGRHLVENHGWKYMFRGIGITLLRAFPVNGIIFPVYEFTLMKIQANDNGITNDKKNNATALESL